MPVGGVDTVNTAKGIAVYQNRIPTDPGWVIQLVALFAGSSGSSLVPAFPAVAFFCLTQTHIFPDTPLSRLKGVAPLIINYVL